VPGGAGWPLEASAAGGELMRCGCIAEFPSPDEQQHSARTGDATSNCQ